MMISKSEIGIIFVLKLRKVQQKRRRDLFQLMRFVLYKYAFSPGEHENDDFTQMMTTENHDQTSALPPYRQ